MPEPPPPRVPPPPTQPAGWYADPWGQGNWRWYDGQQWTAHIDQPRIAPVTLAPTGVGVAVEETKKPRLPSFLSIPVVVAAVPSLLLLLFAFITGPLPTLLGLTTFFIVAPPLLWLDRLEPEPWSSKIHTFLLSLIHI